MHEWKKQNKIFRHRFNYTLNEILVNPLENKKAIRDYSNGFFVL